MAEGTVPVDAAMANAGMGALAASLPKGWKLMPIGAVRMMQLLGDGGERTKDVDVVAFAVVGDEFRVPAASELQSFASKFSSSVTVRKDETGVIAEVPLEAGTIFVELVRGRNPASGGYFISRKLLEACAGISKVRGDFLDLPKDGLAFLKAWAATDQGKLVESGRDSKGFHAARAAAFRGDVERIARTMLDSGERPASRHFADLLRLCPAERRRRVEEVLRRAGWET